MLFVGHQQLFPPSMLPSFLQGEALEVGSIWVLLVQKTGLASAVCSEVLRVRERAPQQAV